MRSRVPHYVARRLRQLVSIIEDGTSHKADDLAVILDTSPRTIYRDISFFVVTAGISPEKLASVTSSKGRGLSTSCPLREACDNGPTSPRPHTINLKESKT